MISTKVRNLEDSVFIPIGETKFKELYKGNDSECQRILQGEHKILFYDKNDINRKVDIKVSWEYNRFHHAPVVAFFCEQGQNSHINSLYDPVRLDKIFDDSNAMEVGISAINIITSFLLLGIEQQTRHKAVVGKHLKESLAYIIQHYEKGIVYSANHYFFNLISVLWICETIGNDSYITKLKLNTCQSLKKLLRQFISPDGSLYEGSTHYHKYVTESFLLFLYEFDFFGFDSELRSFADKMVGFARTVSINNNIIGIGDNDSGRILPLPSYFEYESSNICLINELASSLHLKESKESLNNERPNRKDSFGLYILNSFHWSIAIRLETGASKHRRVIGGHCHNDQLHISSFYDGVPLFVDSGVYSYISKNNHRLSALRTSSHNTVEIDNHEQNKIYNSFNYSERTAVGKVMAYTTYEFVGEHNAYKNFGITHRRRVFFESDNLSIQDNLLFNEAKKEHVVKVYYHIHPAFDVQSDLGSILITNDRISFRLNATGVNSIRIEDSFYSNEYGRKEKNKVIILEHVIKRQHVNASIIVVVSNM